MRNQGVSIALLIDIFLSVEPASDFQGSILVNGDQLEPQQPGLYLYCTFSPARYVPEIPPLSRRPRQTYEVRRCLSPRHTLAYTHTHTTTHTHAHHMHTSLHITSRPRHTDLPLSMWTMDAAVSVRLARL